MWRAPVGVTNCFKMLSLPIAAIVYFDGIYRHMLLNVSFRMRGNGNPLKPGRRLDLVSIAPTVFIVLHVVVKDKRIRAPDEVEISAPRKIRRLHDHDGLLSR